MKDNIGEIWEDLYSEGKHLNKYPWDAIVTFIFRNYSKIAKKEEIKILEVGCGAGNNLWFAAREGFNVTGIDISESAINYAKNRFLEDGLNGEFFVSAITELPFESNTFDLIIDRAVITCLSNIEAKIAINEIKRTLKPNGKIFFNPYSDKHSACISGEYRENGLTTNIKKGLTGIGDICFYGRKDIYNVFSDGWKINNIQHAEIQEEHDGEYINYADWRIIAEKIL